jgi:hypothetical protein
MGRDPRRPRQLLQAEESPLAPERVLADQGVAGDARHATGAGRYDGTPQPTRGGVAGGEGHVGDDQRRLQLLRRAYRLAKLQLDPAELDFGEDLFLPENSPRGRTLTAQAFAAIQGASPECAAWMYRPLASDVDAAYFA